MHAPRPPALLISAYDARSHRRWRVGVVDACPAFDWTAIALPPRHFAWRVRGNALGLLEPVRRAALGRPPALVLATSMTDVVALRALCPALASTPLVVYFHENQFAYPSRAGHTGDDRLEDVRFASVLRALAADRVVFNSAWNRDSFLAGARALLARMPDAVPAFVAERLAARSELLPVPLEDACFGVAESVNGRASGPFTLVWNHRWEHDKAPERLHAALLHVRAAGVRFRLHVLGERFRDAPEIFRAFERDFPDALGHFGFVPDPSAYRAVLAESDVVVSTALQDFQGLSVLDAVAAGCDALAPARLAYPEFLPERCLYASFPADPEAEAQALATALLARVPQRSPAPDLADLAWSNLAPRYGALLAGAAANGGS